MRRRNTFIAVAAGAAGLVMAAGLTSAFSDQVNPPGQAATDDSTAESGDGYFPSALEISGDGDAGVTLVDDQGFTLYRFDEDSSEPPTSNCSGDCETQWPPALTDGDVEFAGDASVLGTVEREDGTEQITVGGWPVYRYAGDAAPGDTEGEGAAGTWWSVAPTGQKAQDATEGAEGAGGEQVVLQTANDAELGNVLTDGEGFTLYRFDEDTADPPASNCEGDCATAWPPVLSSDDIEFDGDASILGTVQREDGSEQVTVDGWPVYRYAEDAEPGDIEGEGAAGTWWAISPNGMRAAEDNDDGRDEEGVWLEGYCPTGIETVDHPELGEILTDNEGFTLYRFDEDTAEPPATNCNGDCAEAWPPVLDMETFDFDGDPSLIGSVTRDNGLEQVTIGGWPVYRYAEDTAPGDVNGQGVSGTWFAMTPEGGKAGDETGAGAAGEGAGAEAPGGSGSGGGY
ncbi:hypothetical protein ACFO4E_18510 [Nocardiopsis mangrovi]|uniref:Lipoprotein n=1 Tax=Nocardiopsis mangrovi TaxID=1179818 RepID=A0ABV9E0F8_9ACTN